MPFGVWKPVSELASTEAKIVQQIIGRDVAATALVRQAVTDHLCEVRTRQRLLVGISALAVFHGLPALVRDLLPLGFQKVVEPFRIHVSRSQPLFADPELLRVVRIDGSPESILSVEQVTVDEAEATARCRVDHVAVLAGHGTRRTIVALLSHQHAGVDQAILERR